MSKLKIRVCYRNEWYNASSIRLDEEGNISFEYLHDLSGAVDSEHVSKYYIEVEE